MDSRAIIDQLPRLRRYARALVGDRAAADDLVQDTLERARSRIGQWRPGGDLRAWLFGIMHNLHIDQVRRPSLDGPSSGAEEIEVPIRATQPERMELEDLAAALARLPQEQSAVLLLVALDEMRYEDIAQTLNIPIGTVMSRLARGRERLRRMLDEHPNPSNLRVVR